MNEIFQNIEQLNFPPQWRGKEEVHVIHEGMVITVYINEWWSNYGVAKEIVLGEEQIKMN